MDKIIDLLGKLLPLIRYYPRWAQAVLAGGLAILLVCVFIAIFKYPAASKEQTSCEPPNGVRSDIESRVAGAQQLYKQLGLSLSNWYGSVVSLRSDLLRYTEAHPNILSYVEKPLPKDLEADDERVIASLQRVSDALMAIHNNDFASRCWAAGAARNAAFLASIRAGLLGRGYQESEASIQPTDIPYLVQFFSLAIQKLGAHKFEPLLQAVLTTNIADREGRAIDNENLRVFLIGGNLLFGFVDRKKSGGMVVAYWGAAMISDIFGSIPDANIVRDQLGGVYPDYRCYVGNLPVNIERSSLVDQTFSSAVVELGKRKDLLVFDVPEKTPNTPTVRHGL